MLLMIVTRSFYYSFTTTEKISSIKSEVYPVVAFIEKKKKDGLIIMDGVRQKGK